MLIGPVFTRELVTAPRKPRFYIGRALYVLSLLGLMSTAWLVLTGTQVVRNVGDVARFGAMVFQILAPLQLTLAVFFSALFTASAVAQEKDRKTLILLLLTHLSNSELVLGKLLASLLNVLVLIAASIPVFMLTALLGGVSFAQIAGVLAVTVVSSLAAGSLGSTVALWREKAFLALGMTVLILTLWIGFWESVGVGALGSEWWGISTRVWAIAFSPFSAVLAAARPALSTVAVPGVGNPSYLFLISGTVFGVILNVVAIARVRVWNPPREVQPREDESPEAAAAAAPARSVHSAPGESREVWDNPIIWREICTWAYGRKIVLIRAAYLVLFALAALAVHSMLGDRATVAQTPYALVPLFVLSLVLVNALAVTSLTAERDIKALDLLLVTDITPAEFIFGKLGGIFYVAKEMILLPMLLCVYVWLRNGISFENLAYLIGGLAVMNVFVAMVGVHVGMMYENSRTAVGVSLGTIFFLFLGIATCIRIMIAFSGSFQMQLAPFLAFMIGGGAGLSFALGIRNPSAAIGLASFACPVATFVAIVSYFQGQTLGVFLLVVVTYGFVTAAMLIPAIYEFDVATGRTTGEDG